MQWVAAVAQRADDALFTAARRSQAIVIASLDRAVSIRDRSSVLQGWIRRPLKATRLLANDPATFVDDGYDRLERLLHLHREFAQRLFEVVDSRETEPAADQQQPDLAPVITLSARRAGAAR